MKRLVSIATVALIAGSFAQADPVTQPSGDYKPIGAGLYVRRKDEGELDDGGNIRIPVYSHDGIFAGKDYELGSMLKYAFKYDGGGLGMLFQDQVTLDCKNQTYRSINVKDGGPPIWRAASSLPELAPVFQYACSRKWSHKETQEQKPQEDKQLVEVSEGQRRPFTPNTVLSRDYPWSNNCLAPKGTRVMDLGSGPGDYESIVVDPDVCPPKSGLPKAGLAPQDAVEPAR